MGVGGRSFMGDAVVGRGAGQGAGVSASGQFLAKLQQGRLGKWVERFGFITSFFLLEVFLFRGGGWGDVFAEAMTSSWGFTSCVSAFILSATCAKALGSFVLHSCSKHHGGKPRLGQVERQKCCGVADDTAEPHDKVSQVNEAIVCAVRKDDLEKAEQLLMEFETSGGTPDAVSYNWLIRGRAKRGDIAAAERWLKRMESQGVKPTVFTYNQVLEARAKADKSDACEQWLNRMLASGIQPDRVSFSIAITASAKRGDVGVAESWLKKMITAGFQPDEVSYFEITHAGAINGALERAEYWLQEMESQCAASTDVRTKAYTAVIDACTKRGESVRAEGWYGRMIEKGLQPDAVFFRSMIGSCVTAGNLAHAEAWHERMVERGFVPSERSYGVIVDAYVQQAGRGSAKSVEKWFDRLEEAGVTADAWLYACVINAYGRLHDAQGALRIFNLMQARGIMPSKSAYYSMIKANARIGRWKRVENLATDMARDGIALDRYILFEQLLAYATNWNVPGDRAEACFRSAIGSGVQPNDSVLDVLARAVGPHRCAELVEELCGGHKAIRDIALARAGPRIHGH